MILEVNKKDIKHIGNTQYADVNGNTLIICNGKTCEIELILLRSILKCFGDEYKIIDTEDFGWDEENPIEEWNIEIQTNLPFDKVRELDKA